MDNRWLLLFCLFFFSLIAFLPRYWFLWVGAVSQEGEERGGGPERSKERGKPRGKGRVGNEQNRRASCVEKNDSRDLKRVLDRVEDSRLLCICSVPWIHLEGVSYPLGVVQGGQDNKDRPVMPVGNAVW